MAEIIDFIELMPFKFFSCFQKLSKMFANLVKCLQIVCKFSFTLHHEKQRSNSNFFGYKKNKKG